MVLKIDTKEKKVSGTTTITKGAATTDSGSFSSKLDSFSKFTSAEYTGKTTKGKISCEQKNEKELSCTMNIESK